MNFQEKLQVAAKIREMDPPMPVSQELFDKFPVRESQEVQVKTREGETTIYIHTPLGGTAPYPLYVNIHGGGFVKGHKPLDTLFCRQIVHALNCVVIDIDYKLAPEKPYPYGLHECYDIVKWAYDHANDLNIDREKIAVGGHSAGGTFTAQVALMANETKEFSIKLQILDYPCLDFHTDPELKEPCAMPVERMKAYNELYIDPSYRKHPLASPIYAPIEMLKGLPPALIITAETDNLRDEGEKYAALLLEAGVEVTAKRFLGSEHGFTIRRTGDFEEGQQMIIEALQKAFR